MSGKNKTDCSFVRKNLFSYGENALSDPDRKTFENHIQSCMECSEIVSEFLSLTSIIDIRKSDKPNPFIGTRIMQRIETVLEAEKDKPTADFQRILRSVSVSLLLVIAIIVGFSIVRQKESKFLTNNHQVDIQAMKTGLNIPDFINEDKLFLDHH